MGAGRREGSQHGLSFILDVTLPSSQTLAGKMKPIS